MPGTICVAIATPSARTSHRTISLAKGEFIPPAILTRGNPRAMKIIVLQDYLRSGGTERHSILLAREFAALGHEASLLTFRPGGALCGTAGPAVRSLQPFDTGLDWFGPGLLRTVLKGR